MSVCVFRGCYNSLGGIDQVIPVDAYIPGCPPPAQAIVDGLISFCLVSRIRQA